MLSIIYSYRKSAPQFLLNIYNRLADEANEAEHLRNTRSINNLLTVADEKAIEQSDIIMTFLNKSKYTIPI